MSKKPELVLPSGGKTAVKSNDHNIKENSPTAIKSNVPDDKVPTLGGSLFNSNISPVPT